MKKVGILYHPLNESALSLAEDLKNTLLDKGISGWSCSAWDETTAISQLNGTELIITIGGDGTILRASQVALEGQIPITGINMGNLGFMTELRADEAKTELFALLDGKGWIDERYMLEVELPPDYSPQNYHALNDIVVARGAIAQMIVIGVSIDGSPFTTYNADGVILSTATGSTGYSLSAGGPILHPTSDEFLLTPILPHLRLSNSHVLPSTITVEFVIKAKVPATISMDGHINFQILDNTRIYVKQSKKLTRFLRIHPSSFYSTLEQRLKGKIKI